MNRQYSLTLSIWFGYLFFVVYGSLVPLTFKPLPLDQAWSIFQHIPMYQLGVESRADWISNGVLYVPIGFLTAHLLIQIFSRFQRGPLLFLAGLFSICLAIGVEFTQIFFPPRTVSLNDLLAESVGSLIGLVLAARYTEWFKILLHAIFSNPRRLVLHLLEAYLAGYVAFSLFPYDILLSGGELEQKIQGDNWGWLFAGDPHGKILIGFKLLSELILTLPFGLFLGYRSVGQSATFKQAAWLGLFLGGFIEIAQFFTATGVSQGLSVMTRIAGFCAGLLLWLHRDSWSPDRLMALLRRYQLPLGVLYLMSLLLANGWFSYPWRGSAYAAYKLADLNFLPFYYHYYTTEAKALFSLASVCLMYIPIGLFAWSRRDSPSQAFFYALSVAAIVETGKLFLHGVHSDPTNVLLGALASWAVLNLAKELAKAAKPHSLAESTSQPLRRDGYPSQVQKNALIDQRPASYGKSYSILLPSLIFTACWAAMFPVFPALLVFILTACAALVWHRPVLLIVILPAMLPILDFAPWSGRFYLDEFDLLLLTCLSIGYARMPPRSDSKPHANIHFVLVSGLLMLSFAVSTIRGLMPWQILDANAFTNYNSLFNALRIGKGALWAFLCFGLLQRFVAAEIDTKRPFAIGMVSGLLMTVVVILWERLTFASLFDFANDYRVTGLFSSMHTGGAYIECFLAVAMPFLVALIFQTRGWTNRLAGALLLLATTYALMVTFSRNGYAAYGVAAAIILFFALFKSAQQQQRIILAVMMAGAMLAVAIPVFTGQFAQHRISSVGKDYGVRQSHWEDALNIRSPDWATTLFGMGLGRYPASHYLLSGEGSHAGSYQLRTEGDNTFLRLGSGDPIYVEQIVSIEPHQNYVLRLNVRTNQPAEKISVLICEKWLLTSFDCLEIALVAGSEAGKWSSLKVPFASGMLGANPWFASKPVKFALRNLQGKSTIDIGNVQLETASGQNLLLNGDFSKEMDHWFFSTDYHLQWHTHSLPVAVLFDQGWFGAITWCLFLIIVIKYALGGARRGDLHAAAALAAICGFIVLGLFDTLVDAPRFLFLLLLLGWFCANGKITQNKVLNNGH